MSKPQTIHNPVSAANVGIVPCLWFDDQAEAAAQFYIDTFGGGSVSAISRYPESSDNPSGKPRGSVLTVEFEVAGLRFTGLNGGPHFTINPSISFFVHVDTAAEADRLSGALARGGSVLMPLGEYAWSPRYAWVQDRFGVSWQVMAGKRPSGGGAVAPCLMFSNERRGQAAAALQVYARVLGGRVEALEHYAAGQGPEDLIQHGRIAARGVSLTAMDSPIDHAFGFNEGLSLQVMCDDQAELDRCWAELSEGGEQGPCGWLKDRFGVSWQVVPAAIAEWLTSPDTAARERAFAAVMRMKKLDIAAIQAAFAGTAR